MAWLPDEAGRLAIKGKWFRSAGARGFISHNARGGGSGADYDRFFVGGYPVSCGLERRLLFGLASVVGRGRSRGEQGKNNESQYEFPICHKCTSCVLKVMLFMQWVGPMVEQILLRYKIVASEKSPDAVTHDDVGGADGHAAGAQVLHDLFRARVEFEGKETDQARDLLVA